MWHQIVLSEFYGTVDKLSNCYQIVEPQALKAVIPQQGNTLFGIIWKQQDYPDIINLDTLSESAVSDKQGIALNMWY